MNVDDEVRLGTDVWLEVCQALRISLHARRRCQEIVADSLEAGQTLGHEFLTRASAAFMLA